MAVGATERSLYQPVSLHPRSNSVVESLLGTEAKGLQEETRRSADAMRGNVGPSQPRRRQHNQSLSAYCLLSPALMLYIVFIAIPLVGIVLISFLQWNLISPPHFAGLHNYRAVVHDSQLGQTLRNTFLLDILTTMIHVALGLIFALAVNSVRSRIVDSWARTAIVLPFFLSAATVALMWSYILAGETGPLNYYLAKIGITGPNWLAFGTWSLPGLVIIDVWASVGFTFIIFLVRLQSIPTDMYEAGHIDGAGTVASFRFITLPMLSPSTFFAAVLGFIGAFEIFTWPLIATNGGTGIATQTMLLDSFRTAFQTYDFGYSAVLSLINVGLLVSFLTVMTFIAKRGVHYERV